MVDRLVRCAVPILNKYRLYVALALDGETIHADEVLEAIHAFFEEAKTKTWMLTKANGSSKHGWSSCRSAIGRLQRLKA